MPIPGHFRYDPADHIKTYMTSTVATTTVMLTVDYEAAIVSTLL